MKVIPELSKNAWKVIITIVTGPKLASEISKLTNLPLSRISESLNQVEKTGIIKQRTRRKQLELDAPFAEILQKFLTIYSKEHLIDCFERKKLNVLFQILQAYNTLQSLELITGYSPATIKRILKKLQSSLFIYQPKKGSYAIREEYYDKLKELHIILLAYFMSFLNKQNISWKEIKIYGNNILIQSPMEKILGFSKTGFSLFSSHGIGIIETNLNYFVNTETKPRKEEIFVHALVFSKNDRRKMMLCILFADLNKIELKNMTELLLIYQVEKEANAIFNFLNSKGKKQAEFLPSYEEYSHMRRDYAR